MLSDLMEETLQRLKLSASETPDALKTPVDRALANFPLPPELRDHVYQYLLDGAFVNNSAKPTTGSNASVSNAALGRRHIYDFSTSILAVNQQIHAEALQLLRERNIFVLITYQWHGFASLLRSFGVPIVRDNCKAVQKFKHHSLRLHFKASTKNGLYLHTDEGGRPTISQI